MQLAAIIARALAEDLSEEEREIISGVRWQTKPRPEAQDLERGVCPEQLGSFFGIAYNRQLQAEDLEDWDATMPPHLGAAAGTITLYLENIRPLTAERVRIVFLHEAAHALGYTEDEICEQLGLTLEGACSSS